MKKDVIFAVVFLSSVTTGCASDDYQIDPNDEALLTIETEDEFTIEFAQLANGALVVSEVGPGNVPSKIADLASQDATPLEIYLAVAPGEHVPLALEAHHAMMTDEEPRDFSVSFRHSYSGEIYNATCTYAVDYDWFSEFFDQIGWTYSSYRSAYTSYHVMGPVATQHLITHVCNYWANFGNDPIFLWVLIHNESWYWLDDIDVGERGVIYVLGSQPETHWYSLADLGWSTDPDQTNTIRHGIMAP